jgi:DNA-damage-inducible protein D
VDRDISEEDSVTNELEPASSSPFDRIKQVRADGSGFWSARRLQALMAYAAWRNFQPVLVRAIQTASNTGMDVDGEFVQVGPVVGSRKRSGSGQFAGGDREDYELSRQAAYLVAMNGDPNKPEVAAAQIYFAGRTRQAELAEQKATELPGWALALHALVDQQAAMEVEQRRQAQQLNQVTAKVVAIEGAHDEFTALAYAKLNDFSTQRAYLARVGAAATRLMKERGKTPHKRQDATFGKINVYPLWALEEAFAATPEYGQAS